jgi:hypothetical protein
MATGCFQVYIDQKLHPCLLLVIQFIRQAFVHVNVVDFSGQEEVQPVMSRVVDRDSSRSIRGDSHCVIKWVQRLPDYPVDIGICVSAHWQ